MPYNPGKYNRQSIRLPGYNYAQAGLYFITLCCYDRKCLFGEIIKGEMVLNDSGNIANVCWLEIPQHFPNVILHKYVIMPNHVHGIVELVGAKNIPPDNNVTQNIMGVDIVKNFPTENTNGNRLPNDNEPKNDDSKNLMGADGVENMIDFNGTKNLMDVNGAKNFSPPRSPSKTIGSVVRGYKIGVTKWMRQNTNVHNVWQRNYYEHIIRNDKSFEIISNYIINNPKKWDDNKFHGC